MNNSPTVKLDVENSNSVQDIKTGANVYSAILDRSFSDVEKQINSSSKVRRCINGSKHEIEARFCFVFGVIIVEVTPYVNESFKKPSTSNKTKIVVHKNHIHSQEDNEKAFDILLEYLENN